MAYDATMLILKIYGICAIAQLSILGLLWLRFSYTESREKIKLAKPKPFLVKGKQHHN